MAPTADTYDADRLVDFLADRSGHATLRSTARRLNIDPAVLCRPLTANQADTYATRLGAHPSEIWPTWLANS